MITTRIRGGLGNQLFQYCAGRALSLRHGVDLGLDLRDFDRPRAFKVGLGHFNTQTVQTDLLPPCKEDGVRALARFVKGGYPKSYREASLGYDAQFETLGKHTHLKGYWQTERYFDAFEAEIRSDLQIITPPSAQNSEALSKIAAAPAVSLHIRRGDYVSNEKFNTAHGTCDLTYYARAANALAQQMGVDPVIFAFSDDPAWVAQNLKLPFETHYIDFNDGDHNYEDLRLMAACKHHIIANSSFSWWGAWLNPDPAKIVVGPTQWFADPGKSNPDILPKTWQTI
jgi:hypothetical protein